MKFFPYNENLERQQKKIMSRFRKLMNGETSHQLELAGINYRKAYGVSLVHLRQLMREFEPDNNLAERLWHRNIRESMILATMLAKPNDLADDQIIEWAGKINNIELAEQVAFNLLGRRNNIQQIIEKWIFHQVVYVRYSALMAIGWHFRFVGTELSLYVKENLPIFDALVTDKIMIRSVAHCLKMAARFNSELSKPVAKLAGEWSKSGDLQLQMTGIEVLDEIMISL